MGKKKKGVRKYKPKPKSKKAIVLKDLKTRLAIKPDSDIIIRLPESERDQKEYYLDTIKRQKETIKKYKDLINSLSGKQEELKYLKEFRNMFAGNCHAFNHRKTIIQCTETIKKGDCEYPKLCTLRKKFDKLVKV